jgi:glycosyltransferase involved in cell wall biosynthesis
VEYDSSVKEQIDIVIPVFQAGSIIRQLLERIEIVVDRNQLNVFIILVDDGSKDNSWEIISNWLSTTRSNATAIKLYKNYGQHPATMAGLKYSTGEFVVIMDCDLQDQPEAIPFLVSALKENDSDLVIVRSKYKRNIIIKLTSQVFHVFSSVPKDITTFRIVRRELIQSLLKYPEAHKISGPILTEISRKTDYIEYQRADSTNGTRYNFSARLGIAMKYILSRSTSIITLFFTLGSIVSFLALIYMSTIFYQVLANKHPLPSGLNQIVILLSFVISISSFGFGFVMLLLKDIFGYVKGNPTYEISLIESTKS